MPDQHYFRCRECGLIVLRPLLSEQALEHRYAEARLGDGSSFEAALTAARGEINTIMGGQSKDRHRFWRLASEIYDVEIGNRKPGKILDIGCGIGSELLLLRRKGWDIFGTDIDRVAIAALSESFPGHFWITGSQSSEWSEKFDVVMKNQVLEHLTDPKVLLRSLLGLLKPGGQLVIVTPNAASWARSLFGARWIQYWPPEHVALYGPDQIRRLLRDSGWQVRTVSTYAAPGTDYALSVRQFLHLPLEPGTWEKLPWFPLAWAGTFLCHGSELVAVAVPAEC